MWIKQELFLLFMVTHPGRASRGIVSLLRLRSRMRETMGHFSSKPLTTKYRQDTQETSILPKTPLFPQPVRPLCHDHWLFIYLNQDDSYYHAFHSHRNGQWRSSGPPKPCISWFSCVHIYVCKNWDYYPHYFQHRRPVHFWKFKTYSAVFWCLVWRRLVWELTGFLCHFQRLFSRPRKLVQGFSSAGRRGLFVVFRQVMEIWLDNSFSWWAVACQKHHDHKRYSFFGKVFELLSSFGFTNCMKLNLKCIYTRNTTTLYGHSLYYVWKPAIFSV